MQFTLDQIKEFIPHREPFLFLSAIKEFVDNERVKAVYQLNGGEWFLQGHFPNKPIMPGVLILEGMAQAGCFFCFKSSNGAPKGSLLYLSQCKVIKWKKQVTPPATIMYDIVFRGRKLNFWVMEARAWVENSIVCEAEIWAFLDTKPD